MKWRNGFDPEENAAAAARCAIAFDPEEDRAVQADALETNINAIVARFRRSGVPPQLRGKPYFADVSEGFDLAMAMQVTRDAREAFDALGAEVRRRFRDDPVELAAFLQDENNREEAERLGLVRKRPPEPVSAPPATPPANGGEAPAGGSVS